MVGGGGVWLGRPASFAIDFFRIIIIIFSEKDKWDIILFKKIKPICSDTKLIWNR